MDSDQKDRLFRSAVAKIRQGALSDAALLFRRLVDSGSDEPFHLSYCGLLTAAVSGQVRQGLELCERALRYGADEPEVVINLARVYEQHGARTRAVETLRRGLRHCPGHPALQQYIDRLSLHRRPPLSFVERNHPLNKFLAIKIARLTDRSARTAPPLVPRKVKG